MNKLNTALFSLFILSALLLGGFGPFRNQGRVENLSSLVEDKNPWETLEANSEQRQPFYIGASPRQFILEGKKLSYSVLPEAMLALANQQSQVLLKKIGLSTAELEIWPYLTDQGDPNWVFARYRKSPNSPWTWFKPSHWKKTGQVIAPALPQFVNPHTDQGFRFLFSDFLEFDNLYQKPLYPESVWTRDDGGDIFAGWLSLQDKNSAREMVAKDPSIRARILPQPARLNDIAKTFVVLARAEEPLDWKQEEIQWSQTHFTIPKDNIPVEHLIFSSDFIPKYQKDIRILAGETEAVFPISNRKMTFSKKSSALKDNRLLDIVDYLKERYESLNIVAVKQEFTWRGIPQSNLIAMIPGKDRTLPPILLADHFDTAFAEDHYSKTHTRVTNPGADDNATGTATLLRAAEELKNRQPLRDIWLLHLTGEEFPSDDLGARHFFRTLLKEKRNIHGMVLVDMIGIRDPKDPIFQINSGKTPESLQLSALAMQVAKTTPSNFVPVFRSRFDDKSYLYNTDGYIPDSLGFPVVFFNEHLHRHNIGKINQHYHQSTDLTQHIDFNYAGYISQLAITTLWNAAIQ